MALTNCTPDGIKTINVADECFDPPDGLYLKVDARTSAVSPYETTRIHKYIDPDFGFTVVIPKGFRTDLASIPWVLKWLFGEAGIHQRGCMFHDAAYRQQLGAQWQSDALMRAIHMKDGVPKYKRLLMFFGVRLFGKKAWKRASKSLNVARAQMGVTPEDRERKGKHNG